LGITTSTIYIHGDGGGTVSIGNGVNISSYTEGIKVNNNGSIIIPSGNVSILKNATINGTLTTGGMIDATGDSIFRSSNGIISYNSGGNARIKLQSNAGTQRLEVDGSKDLYIYNDANQSVFVFGNNRASYPKGTMGDGSTDCNFNRGDFSSLYIGGIPVVASMTKLKDNIENIDNNTSGFYKINPKKYTRKNNGNVEYGFIIEDIEKIDELKHCVYDDTENSGLKYLDYYSLFCLNIQETLNLRKELDELKDEVNSLKNKTK
jgi:hypothetical protein